MVEIPISNGMVSLVDDEDAKLVSRYTWYALIKHPGTDPYAAAHRSRKEDGKGRNIMMHRLIMGFPEKLDVDHINGNRMDNQRSNLRLATRSQNMGNARRISSRRKHLKGTSPVGKRWRSQIFCKGVDYHLGYFDTEEEAHATYMSKAKELFGEFANAG